MCSGPWNPFLCLLRCCSTSSSLSMWSWTWWPGARGLRSCSASRDMAPPHPPAPTLSTSWSRARCRASCGWTEERSCWPSRVPPSGYTWWATPQPRLTSSASLKSTKAWSCQTHLRKLLPCAPPPRIKNTHGQWLASHQHNRFPQDVNLKDKPDICGSCCGIFSSGQPHRFGTQKHRLLD